MRDLEALAKLATEATPGPWARYGDLVQAGSDGGARTDIAECLENDGDAAYIAAASPDVVLALVRVALAAREVSSHSEVVVDGEGLAGDWCHFCDKQTPGHESWCDWVKLRAALADLDR